MPPEQRDCAHAAKQARPSAAAAPRAHRSSHGSPRLAWRSSTRPESLPGPRTPARSSERTRLRRRAGPPVRTRPAWETRCCVTQLCTREREHEGRRRLACATPIEPLRSSGRWRPAPRPRAQQRTRLRVRKAPRSDESFRSSSPPRSDRFMRSTGARVASAGCSEAARRLQPVCARRWSFYSWPATAPRFDDHRKRRWRTGRSRARESKEGFPGVPKSIRRRSPWTCSG